MKKLIFLLLIVITAVFFIQCDKIEPPYTEGDPIPPIDTTECPIPDFPADTHHVKTVLIEEYTGHTCVNCPTAAITAHDIVSTYGEKAVLMTIHAGYFAETESGNYSLDLNTTPGTALHTEFGIAGNPAATFNRKYVGGSRVFEAYTAWETTFVQVQDTVPVLDMQMITNFNSSTNKVCVHVQTEYLVDLSSPLKIAMYVTEDSIIGYQKNNNSLIGTTPDIVDYVFMDVLRGAINGAWGTDLSTTAVIAETKKVTSFSYTLNSGWVADHCHVIAVVYNADTYEILQVVEGEVTP